MNLLKVFLAITALYILLVLFKSRVRKPLCALCLAVGLTWAGLLTAYRLGWFGDGVLLALIMGQSVTGIYYLLEKYAPRPWLLFRLPLLLTLTYLFYGAVTLQAGLGTALFLVGLWLCGLVLYVHRTSPRIREVTRKIVECCGNW